MVCCESFVSEVGASTTGQQDRSHARAVEKAVCDCHLIVLLSHFPDPIGVHGEPVDPEDFSPLRGVPAHGVGDCYRRGGSLEDIGIGGNVIYGGSATPGNGNLRG